MKPRLTFYPLGNADCCLVELSDGRVLINDFAATRGNEGSDLRIDLPRALRADLGSRGNVDVLALSHLDQDHYQGTSDFFYLEHDIRYQGSNRIKTEELWVPAAVITEKGLDGEARIIQLEARYRLKEGKGVRVFSHPHELEEWLKSEGLELRDREHLITDAGCLVPGFSFEDGGVEIFVHSPFAESADDGRKIMRNSTSIVLHATFKVAGREARVFFGADLGYEDLVKIVSVTKRKGNEVRLEHDIAKLPHHCSYLSLAPEKGNDLTIPEPEIQWLYEKLGHGGVVLVSSSNPIPSTDTNDPPHRQAACYYKRVGRGHRGEFVVTMAHPKRSAPERLRIEIGPLGVTVKKATTVGAALTSRPAPRAGSGPAQVNSPMPNEEPCLGTVG